MFIADKHCLVRLPLCLVPGHNIAILFHGSHTISWEPYYFMGAILFHGILCGTPSFNSILIITHADISDCIVFGVSTDGGGCGHRKINAITVSRVPVIGKAISASALKSVCVLIT